MHYWISRRIRRSGSAKKVVATIRHSIHPRPHGSVVIINFIDEITDNFLWNSQIATWLRTYEFAAQDETEQQ